MSLATILVLLQTAIALLATPNMTPSQQSLASGFAAQAVLIANEALQTYPTSSLPDVVSTAAVPVAPVIQPVLPSSNTNSMNIGSPDLSSVQTPPVQPTCTLKVVPVPNTQSIMDITWNSTGLPNDVTGQLYVWVSINGNTEYKLLPIQGLGQFSGAVSGSSGTQHIAGGPIINFQNPTSAPQDPNNTNFRLILGAASCDFSVPAQQ